MFFPIEQKKPHRSGEQSPVKNFALASPCYLKIFLFLFYLVNYVFSALKRGGLHFAYLYSRPRKGWLPRLLRPGKPAAMAASAIGWTC